VLKTLLQSNLCKYLYRTIHGQVQGLYFEFCEKVSKRAHQEIKTQRRSSARVHRRPVQGVHRANTWKVLKNSQGRQSARSVQRFCKSQNQEEEHRQPRDVE
jgi:hypothetical protein